MEFYIKAYTLAQNQVNARSAFHLFVPWGHRKGTSDFERLLNPLALYEPVWVFYCSASNCQIQSFEVTRKKQNVLLCFISTI